MTVARRIFVEKRSIMLPLLAALVVNIGVFALIVHPLGAQSASAADRAAAAAQSLRVAQRDIDAARALVTGKSLADQELTTFYLKVLPGDYPTARRMTYAWVPALAHKANVRYEARHMEIELGKEPGKDVRLARLKTRAVLVGGYEAVRQFVYQLETAPEFVIIDDVSLTQAEADRPLTLTLELSTYYRLGANGT